MSVLFTSGRIGGMTTANRFVRSATWEGLAADNGAATPKLIRAMIDLAEGGVGLIISGHAFVSPEGQAGPWQLGIDKDELIDGLKQMTEAVHGAGGKIVAQLAHAGHFAPKALTGQPPHVVSDFEGLAKSPRHELTREDITLLVQAFAAAAGRARAAGFDGVQIHSGHGYLLSQFLSPAYNRRTDEYGGPIENRARIHLEILAAIRQTVGKDYPVLIKINSEDCIENGLTRKDSLAACKMLAAAGLDAVELSGGTLTSGKLSPSRSGISSEDREAYFQEAARALKKEIAVPVILVGGVRSLNVAENLVNTGAADFLSMSRPLIREPGLINRWKSGDLRPALCKSDNLCFGPALEGKGIYCVVAEKEAL
ncbi:MAG: NADH:flavin oxidoreductase [Desulfobacteraceae bacterium]|nr:MAG: NADH:flavin oxidoreductase [Desulfobacteraceae bacterium]